MSATITLTTRFNLDTGKFLFTDTSNYAAQGSPDTGIKGCLRITGPSGLVYGNAAFATPVSATADITTAGSFVNSSINIPLDASGVPQIGGYLIEYNVYITGGTDAGLTKSFTSYFDYCFDEPTISITQYSDCINAIFTSTDSTNYVVDSVTPSNTRTHALIEVGNTGRTNISNTNASNTVNYPNLYNSNYKTTITSVLTYAFSLFSVVTTVTGTATFTVACIETCDIYCGLKAVEASFESNLSRGDIKAAENDKMKLALLSSYITLYNLAIGCGNTDQATLYIAKIKAIGNFTSSCCTSTGQVAPASVASGSNLETTESDIVASTIQSQAGATLLWAKFSRVDTVGGSGDSCRMPSATKGDVRYVSNFGNSAMFLFPADGERFMIVNTGLTTINASITVSEDDGFQFVCYENGVWTRNILYVEA